MIEAGVAPKPGSDRQRLLRIVTCPENDRVKRALMQIVESRKGGERSDHLCAVASERIGQCEELRCRLADRQDTIRRGIDLRRLKSETAIRERDLADLEFLLGNGGSNQGLQPHDSLTRV